MLFRSCRMKIQPVAAASCCPEDSERSAVDTGLAVWMLTRATMVTISLMLAEGRGHFRAERGARARVAACCGRSGYFPLLYATSTLDLYFAAETLVWFYDAIEKFSFVFSNLHTYLLFFQVFNLVQIC